MPAYSQNAPYVVMSLHRSKNVKDTNRLQTQFTVVAAEMPAELSIPKRQR